MAGVLVLASSAACSFFADYTCWRNPGDLGVEQGSTAAALCGNGSFAPIAQLVFWFPLVAFASSLVIATRLDSRYVQTATSVISMSLAPLLFAVFSLMPGV